MTMANDNKTDGTFDPTRKVGAQAPSAPVNSAPPAPPEKKEEDFDPAMDDMSDKEDEVLPPVAPAPKPEAVRDAPMANSKLSRENLTTKELLAMEPKMNFVIPLEPGEKAGVDFRAVTINGYRFEVKKGVYVELPQSVAKLLMEAYNIENNVFSNHPLNLDRKNDRDRGSLNR